MPKVPALTSKRIIKILEEFGFEEHRQKGSHKIFYNPKTGKRAVVPCHVSDLPLGTMVSILKEAGITRQDFLDSL
ncbi:MAG: type II toxin-antitoxin system HicA family toxin [bacterium]